MMRFDTKYVTKAALIAAMYVVLILVQMIPAASFTFGAVQLRLAEGLTLLPFVEAAAIPGVFLGCLISNIILAGVSGLGLVDVIGGSLVTLAAAYLTSKAKNKYLAAVPPVLLNGLIVSIWVSYYTNMPYGITVLGIAGGEALSVFLFGGLVLYVYERSKIFRRF
ncbi:MAG: QueT transporter family protein [Ezakiella sp.]|nr:QueT transporter family protein [Ezakiella sp.]MDD7761739.1 QueT transporter family protein [Bacillota bacterium]MDY3946370.1 QueT transporter family protein [Ezakiella sp.]